LIARAAVVFHAAGVVSQISTAQLRLVYSLLKPAVAMAARFHVPMRTLAELLRLSYFEVLRREGLSQAAVGDRLGQTARHMRTLAAVVSRELIGAPSRGDVNLDNDQVRRVVQIERLRLRRPER